MFKYFCEKLCHRTLKFILLSKNACIPVKGCEQQVGYDLFSAHDAIIPKYGKAWLNTDVQVEFPDIYCYGRIEPIVNLTWNYHLSVKNSIVNANDKENIGVILFNHSDTDCKIQKGEKIAQFICSGSEIYDFKIVIEENFEKDSCDTCENN